MSSKRLSNTWINGYNFYDPYYYKTALKQNDIWKLDYHLARVFNTPSYCNNLLQDLHGQIETSKLEKHYDMFQPNNPNQNTATTINTFVISILEKIDISEEINAFEKHLVNKAFVWFIFSVNLIIEVDFKSLNTDIINYILEIQEIRGNRGILFDDLITICGSRFKAEKSRTLLSNIINSLSFEGKF